jgi:hypothetical protein
MMMTWPPSTPAASNVSDLTVNAWKAWVEYRSSQENIVEYLCQLCEHDRDLDIFVLSQTMVKIASKLCDGVEGEPCAVGPSPITGSFLDDFVNADGNMTPAYALSSPPNLTAEVKGQLNIADHLPSVKPKSEAVDDESLKLLARLMEDDTDGSKAREKRPVEVLTQILHSDSDLKESGVSIATDCEPNSKELTPKTTLILSLQNQKVASAHMGLDLLMTRFSVVGGRDIDFLYCPVEFGKPFIKGYAIINFRNVQHARTMIATGAEWQWAKLQGYDQNCHQFLKRHSHIRNMRFRPMVWPQHCESMPEYLGGVATKEKESGEAVSEETVS